MVKDTAAEGLVDHSFLSVVCRCGYHRLQRAISRPLSLHWTDQDGKVFAHFCCSRHQFVVVFLFNHNTVNQLL